MRPLRLWAAALALAAADALACGHCVEDRVAAVYDYGMEQEARGAGRGIAYLGVNGRQAQTPRAANLVREALQHRPEIAAGTVRTSVTPAAAAFAWGGEAQALPAIIDALNGELGPAGLHLELLRVWDAKHGLR